MLVVTAGRTLTIRSIARVRSGSLADPLRLKARTRWVALGIAVLGLTVIWADELRTLALSLVAIAAAVVLATKELIMCMSGTLVRASGATFEIGDRIEVEGVRGDVIDHQLLTTTVLEIGPGHQPTGRTVVLPNSVFLTAKVFNETLSDSFVVHAINVPVTAPEQLGPERERLLTIAHEICAPFEDAAAKSLDATAARYNLPFTSPRPSVLVSAPAADKMGLLLRVPVPARQRGQIEQEILRRFYSA